MKLSIITQFFDLRWSYYLGFGATHIALRLFMASQGLPLFANLAVCSALFPVNVIMTVDAVPGLTPVGACNGAFTTLDCLTDAAETTAARLNGSAATYP